MAKKSKRNIKSQKKRNKGRRKKPKSKYDVYVDKLVKENKIVLKRLGRYPPYNRSPAEDTVARALARLKYRYVPEYVLEHLLRDKKAYRVSDFYLPKEDVHVEVLGGWNNPEDKKRYIEKMNIYRKNNIKAVYIFPNNWVNIDNILKKRIKEAIQGDIEVGEEDIKLINGKKEDSSHNKTGGSPITEKITIIDKIKRDEEKTEYEYNEEHEDVRPYGRFGKINKWEEAKNRANSKDFSLIRLVVGDTATEILKWTLYVSFIVGVIFYFIGFSDLGKYLFYLSIIIFVLLGIIFLIGHIYIGIKNSINESRRRRLNK